VGLFVWDPSSAGRTKVVAAPMVSAWQEETATWRHPGGPSRWLGGDHFDPMHDAGPQGPPTIVPPDRGGDLADPPLEMQVDVTDAVRSWLDGATPNHGLVLLPIPDRTVDDGAHTRFQVFASEAQAAEFTPKLTLEFDP